ncbi:putative ribonuclease H-like domain-containing protein [Tanacetum coccineum]
MLVLLPNLGYTLFILLLRFLEIQNQQFRQEAKWIKVDAMQEELLQFKLQKVWILVDLPSGKKAIGTKWVYRNKKDERGVVVRNKARLGAQGYRQEEGIDYDEVFAPVARIEAIRIFLAFASYMRFIVYQMGRKSEYRRGTIDKTLFIKKDKKDIMLVQVYVDDIIFGSTKKSWSDEFEALMKSRFQMSSMGFEFVLKTAWILEEKKETSRFPQKETKQTLGNAVLTLVKKVKTLEVALKRKTKKVVLSDLEDEETENQGRNIQDMDDDPLVSLVRDYMEEKAADFVTPTKSSASGEAQEEDISPTILEAAQTLSKVASWKTRSTNKGKRYKRKTRSAKEKLNSTEVEVNTGRVEVNTGRLEVNPGSAGVNTGSTPVSTPSVVQTVNVIIPFPVKGQREGKAPMTTEDDKEAARQVHLDALLAKRISEEQELSEQQLKRKAEIQEAA